MSYYHGSMIADISTLEARSKLHNSEETVIYLTDSIPYSLLYIWDSRHNELNSKYVTGWIKDGVVYYEEQFSNQLETFYKGVSGYVYCINESKNIQRLNNRDGLFYSTKNVAVAEAIKVDDVYEEMLRLEAEGKFAVLRFNEQSPERQNELTDMIAQAILKENFYSENEEKQKFMKKHFSRSWQEAEAKKINQAIKKGVSESDTP